MRGLEVKVNSREDCRVVEWATGGVEVSGSEVGRVAGGRGGSGGASSSEVSESSRPLIRFCNHKKYSAQVFNARK